jgi:hypothetical protein
MLESLAPIPSLKIAAISMFDLSPAFVMHPFGKRPRCAVLAKEDLDFGRADRKPHGSVLFITNLHERTDLTVERSQ